MNHLHCTMIQLKKNKNKKQQQMVFNCTIYIKQGSWQTALSMSYCIRNRYENHQTHDTSDCQDWWSFSGRIIILAYSVSQQTFSSGTERNCACSQLCLSATGIISISTELQLTGFSLSIPFINIHIFSPFWKEGSKHFCFTCDHLGWRRRSVPKILRFFFFCIQSFMPTLFTKAVQFHISTLASTLTHTHNQVKGEGWQYPTIFLLSTKPI